MFRLRWNHQSRATLPSVLFCNLPLYGLFLLGAILCSGFLSGCHSRGAQSTPEATIQQLANALQQGRYSDAYDCMSRSYRERIGRQQFIEHLRASPSEARQTALSLRQLQRPSERYAIVSYGEHEELRMVHDSGHWRIATDVADFYSQQNPRLCLRSFVRAMERHRYDVVMRFVPNQDLEGMSPDTIQQAAEGDEREEVERLLANLRMSLNNPIEERGDRATMAYGERFHVQFLYEDGVWKIEDLD